MINTSADPAAAFQYIPVPNEHVRAVLAFLGGLVSTTAASSIESITEDAVPSERIISLLASLGEHLSTITTASTEQIAKDAGVTDQEAIDGWTDEDLIKFFAIDTKTSINVGRMLRHLSGHPGQDGALSTRELAEALDVDYSVMKILPTQVKRTLGRHFPGLTPPWRAQSGPRFTPPRANEVFFWVTDERAAQLKRLPD
ncbi:hypothetical protein [Arthrobacter sp. SAFR-044]|uniref:hypothetical protein n=1 Tax=Arthrobacter sp. SAFR-044 TaxID=3387278 RepID=UPI003F7C3703